MDSRLQAICPPTAGGGLPSTGLAELLPVLAIALITIGLLLHRRSRRASLTVVVLLGLAGLSLIGLRAPAARAECNDVVAVPVPAVAATYLVGAAVESINPTPAMIATKQVFLGGYGLSSGTVGGVVPVMDGRYATGILADGVHSRALAISDRTKAIVLAQIETQGVYAAYKNGPYGIEDIRKDAAAAIKKARPSGPALGAGQIMVDSNHTHAGPDTAGVWGGVPNDYLQLIHDRTVGAIVKAYLAMTPAHLAYGTAKGGVAGKDADALITNQFSNDPANQAMDDELRVLQATDATTGKVLVTYLNWSAHPTVLGGGNTLVSADYVGPLSQLLASYGGVGFSQVGTLGRSQPTDRGCPDKALKDAAASTCALKEYADRVFARVKTALVAAKPMTGKAVVDLHSYLIEDPVTNAPIFALANGGFAVGAPILRQTTPPWFTANIVGTTTYSGRIGDVLISGSPGEPYPQIPLTVRAALPGMKGYISLGTAGDFLGYLIAPAPEAYPEPIRRSLLSGDPPPAGDTCSGVPSPIGCPSPIDNDTYFFNPSFTIGERIICSLLRGAGEATGKGTTLREARSQCALFANDLLLPADADTTFETGPYRPVG
ncbi:MAG: hypothetical protein QOE05_2010 [Actinomycetota bacterium]|jgi:hypothetical protein|nr:hypothetical protein [Actinomycetota bacterium]